MRRAILSSLVWIACSTTHSSQNGIPLCTDSLLRTLHLEAVQKEALPVELRVPGEIVSVPELTVERRSLVEGSIIEVYGRVGQPVIKGAPLLLIRSPQLLEREARPRAVQAQLQVQRLRAEAVERMGQDSLASIIEVRNARAELLALEAEYQQLSEQLQLFRRRGELTSF
ncbi:MAG: hypothetical protein N3E49_02380 [Bacteroidia bacterium]|nr:hypothetical protein [Bacteroidia bacterium]